MNKHEITKEVFSEFKIYLDEKFNQNELGHVKIIEQTTRTNGRVTELERWMNRIIGGLIISNIVIVPIVMWMFIQHIKGTV